MNGTAPRATRHLEPATVQPPSNTYLDGEDVYYLWVNDATQRGPVRGMRGAFRRWLGQLDKWHTEMFVNFINETLDSEKDTRMHVSLHVYWHHGKSITDTHTFVTDTDTRSVY